ncbi:PTS system fructose subfamily IIA component [[Clostridium] ultunense Esp]|nr:PTS system fructose subfamily IIA component [[Clostridium] ultunense Esp]
MKTILILCGHGKYASGVGSTLEMLAGHHDDLHYLDFTEDETDVTLKEKMIRIVKEHDGAQVLFICDLLGGTPYKVSAEIANFNPHMEVVAGCNIASIMETLFQKDAFPIQQLADFIVDASKQTTVRFRKLTGKEATFEANNEEGI